MSAEKDVAAYYRLRRKHIKLGGIVGSAVDGLARDGDHKEAIEWLKHANKYSDFIHRPGGTR